MPEPQPRIFMPQQAGMVVGPDGRKLAFLYVPQLEGAIKRLLGARPREVTYRWGYHPGHRIHVLWAHWPLEPEPEEIGVAIPEGDGDPILDFLVGEADIYLTLDPIADRLKETMTAEELAALTNGLTAGLPGVRFRRFRG